MKISMAIFLVNRAAGNEDVKAARSKSKQTPSLHARGPHAQPRNDSDCQSHCTGSRPTCGRNYAAILFTDVCRQSRNPRVFQSGPSKVGATAACLGRSHL